MKKPREFWVRKNDLEKQFDFFEATLCRLKEHPKDADFTDAIKVREVDPAYNAAVQKLVKTLNQIMIAALNGNETTTELECFHLAQEALEEWSRVIK